MSAPTDLAPDTLAVELTDGGVAVEYLDGREVFYNGVPATATGPVRTQPGKEVHLLVTDAAGRQGVLVYVNDRKTEAEILEETGVGRVLLEPGEKAEPFPGVTVSMDGHAVVVDADVAAVDGRVFVFEEDMLGERSVELVEG